MADTAGSRRPADSAFKQQRLKAWQPILTPKWVISSFMAIGVAFIGIAMAVLGASNGVLHVTVPYSTECQPQLATWDATSISPCMIEFSTTDADGWESQDVYVYYQLDNFYQNHRKYVQSKSAKQLSGDTMQGLGDEDAPQVEKDDSMGDCSQSSTSEYTDPSDDKKVYMYPCGLVAYSAFNDTLKIREKDSGKYVMWNEGSSCPFFPGAESEPCPTNPTNIAWKSDVDKKYKEPTVNWIKKNCKYIGGQDFMTSGWVDPALKEVKMKPAGACGAPMCGMRVLKDDGAENTGIYNCWHNVTDQDFIVWMRVAALPSFKKLYRKIPAGALKKNTKYELVVHNRFPVHSFKGNKHFVLSTTSWLGGQNFFLGYAYLIVGAICVALSLGFLAKQLVSPRKMGDPKYLNFK